MRVVKIIYLLILMQSVNIRVIAQTRFSMVIDEVNSVEYGILLEYYKSKYHIIGLGTIIDDTVNYDYHHQNYLSSISENQEVENTYLLRQGFKSHGLVIENDTIYLQGTDIRDNKNFKWNMYRFTMEGDSIDLHEFNGFDNKYGNDIVGWHGTFIKDNSIFSYGVTDGNKFKGSEIVILKMSKLGKLIRENRFYEFADPHNDNICSDICPTADSNFVMVILYYGVPFVHDGTTYRSTDEYIAICKFDYNLDTIWTREVSHISWRGTMRNINGEPHITYTMDGGVVVGAAIDIRDSVKYDKIPYYKGMVEYPLLFCKYDSEGNMVWTDTIFEYKEPGKGTGPIKTIFDMKTARNGDIIGCGWYWNIYDDPEDQAWVFRYSPDGKLKWQHSYVDEEYYAESSEFFEIEEAENGDLICVGGQHRTNIGEFNNRGYTWLMRIDSNGCYTPGCELGEEMTRVITATEDLTTTGLARRIKLYPNPASEYINYELPEGINWQSWTIYNMKGKKMKQGKIDNKIHVQTITGLMTMPKGTYFFVAKSKSGKIGIGKFVKSD